MSTEPVIKRLLYDPHSDKALEIHRHPARFRVLDCGRRYGKSVLCTAEAWQMSRDVIVQKKRRARGWIVAPTYSLSEEIWRVAIEQWKELIAADGIKRGDKKIIFFDGSEAEFKSADNKDASLRGAGLDWLIIDEASRVSRETWESGLRPALADKQGRAIFASTPKGKNHFFEWFNYGQSQDPKYKEWMSWKLPSYLNPYFPKEEWESLRQSMPETLFRQEMEADFIDDAGVVFRGIEGILCGDLLDPVENHRYIMGVDLAKTQDFTVIIVIDQDTKQVVFFDRFNNLDWNFQKEKINWTAKRYNEAMLWIDSTGLGDPIENDLRRDGRRVFGYKFSNKSKQELVEFLVIAIQQKMFTMPDIREIVTELQSYDYEMLPGGKIRYGAPPGLHDDCVISLGLAMIGMKQYVYTKEEKKQSDGLEHLDMRSRLFWENQKKAKERENTDSQIITDDVNIIDDISIF